MLTASQEMWSVRTLDRNISTQYYERHFQQPQIAENAGETLATNKLEILKSPIVAEFLGFKKDDSYSETDLESAIISHLQEFYLPSEQELRREIETQKELFNLQKN